MKYCFNDTANLNRRDPRTLRVLASSIPILKSEEPYPTKRPSKLAFHVSIPDMNAIS